MAEMKIIRPKLKIKFARRVRIKDLYLDMTNGKRSYFNSSQTKFEEDEQEKELWDTGSLRKKKNGEIILIEPRERDLEHAINDYDFRKFVAIVLNDGIDLFFEELHCIGSRCINDGEKWKEFYSRHKENESDFRELAEYIFLGRDVETPVRLNRLHLRDQQQQIKEIVKRVRKNHHQ